MAAATLNSKFLGFSRKRDAVFTCVVKGRIIVLNFGGSGLFVNDKRE